MALQAVQAISAAASSGSDTTGAVAMTVMFNLVGAAYDLGRADAGLPAATGGGDLLEAAQTYLHAFNHGDNRAVELARQLLAEAVAEARTRCAGR